MSNIGIIGRMAEKRMAKQLGGKLTHASGAMQGDKGDIALPDHLVEMKSSTGRSIALKHEWLAKIFREARAVGKKAALIITFTTGDGKPVPSGEWVCVPLSTWKAMVDKDDD